MDAATHIAEASHRNLPSSKDDGRGDLSHALREVTGRYPGLYADTGLAGPGWTFASALVSPGSAELPELLAAQALGSEGLDAKGQAAVLVGRLAYRVAEICAALHLTGRPVPRLGVASVALRRERYRWTYEGQSGDAERLHLRFSPGTPTYLDTREDQLAEIGRDLTEFLLPLIERLAVETRLGQVALWRQAIDMVLAGFHQAGSQLGDEAAAIRDARLFAAGLLPPARSPRAGFAEIRQPGESEPKFLLLRGGCCRYCTIDGAELCGTCPLRPLEERLRLARGEV